MGAIGTPTRHVRGGPLTGQTIPVTTPDHVLINLEFANGALGQLLASFGTAATLAPWMEVHFERATVSFGGQSHEKDAPVSLYVDDESPAAREGWTHGVEIPVDDVAVVEAGIRHFIDVLSGDAEPDPDRRARTSRARHHREGVCVDRGWRLARDRNDLLTDAVRRARAARLRRAHACPSPGPDRAPGRRGPRRALPTSSVRR